MSESELFESLAALGIFIWLGLFVMGIVWLFLPFAIYGFRRDLRKANKISLDILDELRRVNGPQAKKAQPEKIEPTFAVSPTKPGEDAGESE